MNTNSPPTLTSLRIIVLAMMAGILTFGVVAFAIGDRMTHRPDLARLLLPILGLVAVSEVPLYFVVRASVMARLRRSLQEDPPEGDLSARVLPTMATLTIIGAAMAEGFGLFGVVVFLLTGVAQALAAPAIALIILVSRIPTEDKLSAFAAGVSESC